jgi:DNA-3-methyladenine glycosylase
LYGYDDFFQQDINLLVNIKEKLRSLEKQNQKDEIKNVEPNVKNQNAKRMNELTKKEMKKLKQEKENRNRLPEKFYLRNDVVQVAKDLIGKILVTNWDGIITSGRIVESEAYAGEIDKASHAAGGRRTNRTEIIYGAGGTAYVYLCYGIHHMFNIVTNDKDVPHAILIRAVEPLQGIDEMLKRTGKIKADHTLTRGPGNVGKALGIHTKHTGYSLQGDNIFISDDGYRYEEEQVGSSARIGVDYAGQDALLHYRFFVKGNPYVSGKPR